MSSPQAAPHYTVWRSLVTLRHAEKAAVRMTPAVAGIIIPGSEQADSRPRHTSNPGELNDH
jgi:hypothetical protein